MPDARVLRYMAARIDVALAERPSPIATRAAITIAAALDDDRSTASGLDVLGEDVIAPTRDSTARIDGINKTTPS